MSFSSSLSYIFIFIMVTDELTCFSPPLSVEAVFSFGAFLCGLGLRSPLVDCSNWFQSYRPVCHVLNQIYTGQDYVYYYSYNKINSRLDYCSFNALAQTIWIEWNYLCCSCLILMYCLTQVSTITFFCVQLSEKACKRLIGYFHIKFGSSLDL